MEESGLGRVETHRHPRLVRIRLFTKGCPVLYTITHVRAFVVPMRTRLPFRYGIAEMVAAPHVVVEVGLHDGTHLETGYASEHLPPKWFVKDPTTTFADEVAELAEAILAAADLATGSVGASPFALALALDDAQQDWAVSRGVPGLAAGLGPALIERALIDAACRACEMPFIDALERGVLGFDAGAIHPELAGRPVAPVGRGERIAIRHTVGLGDPLTDAEVRENPGDDLPVSLESSIARYGLRWFKLKTSGDADADIARIAQVEEICRQRDVVPRYTIDGNESMRSGEHLLAWIAALESAPQLPGLFDRLVAVEQPLHREVAMDPSTAEALSRVTSRVAVIIDESDADRQAVRRAMDLGYSGGTYKGCKGVFRGLANAALVRARGPRGVLTAEDLCTVPPLTVGQDLVVCAAMGLKHVERNGHHYFGALAPLGVEREALAAHPDLYADDAGRARLHVSEGSVRLASVLRAPFGFAPRPRTSRLLELTVASAVGLV